MERHFFPGPTIKAAVQAAEAKADFPEYYEVKSASYAGKDRPLVPCGIPYRCAHTGDDMGIVSGTIPQDQVERMLKLALETPERTPDRLATRCRGLTIARPAQTFDSARKMQKPGFFNFLARSAQPIRSARADRHPFARSGRAADSDRSTQTSFSSRTSRRKARSRFRR